MVHPRSLFVLGPLAAALLVTAPTRADIAPPGTGCDGKKAGDDCQAYWKVPTGGMPRGQQGPGKCVEASYDATGTGRRMVTCRPLAAPGIDGVTYADGVCAGKRVGDACSDFNQPYDGKGATGACAPQVHPELGKILACVRGDAAAAASAAGSAVPAPTPAPSAAPPAPAPARSTEFGAGREGSKSCSCTLPGGGTPAEQGGLAALLVGVGVMMGRRRATASA